MVDGKSDLQMDDLYMGTPMTQETTMYEWVLTIYGYWQWVHVVDDIPFFCKNIFDLRAGRLLFSEFTTLNDDHCWFCHLFVSPHPARLWLQPSHTTERGHLGCLTILKQHQGGEDTSFLSILILPLFTDSWGTLLRYLTSESNTYIQIYIYVAMDQ